MVYIIILITAALKNFVFTDPARTQLDSLISDQSLSNLHTRLSQSLLSLSGNPTNPPPV